MKVLCGRVSLWLEPLREGQGPSLLLLHELGGSAADFDAAVNLDWAGPVHALEFSGHGRSGRTVGGSYSPEHLVAGADAALAQLGGANVLGVGLGAYVALLLAGARPQLVPRVALLDGAGLAGSAATDELTRQRQLAPLQSADASHELQARPHVDPVAIACLRDDPRPHDYAEKFAAAARSVLLFESASPMPPWWQAVARVPGVRTLQGDRAAAARALAG